MPGFDAFEDLESAERRAAEESFRQEFDTGEDPPSTEDQAAERVVEGLEQATRAKASISRTVSEVERRFAIAECYRAVLQQELFDEATQASAIVQAEVSAFCQRRLEILMGIKVEEAPPPIVQQQVFSKEETTALKALARAATRSQGLASPATVQQAKPVPPAPTLRRRPPPVAPQAVRPAAPPPKMAAGPMKRPAGKKFKEVERPTADGGTKVLRMDVTPQVGAGVNPHALPTATSLQEIEMVNARHAVETAQHIQKGLPSNLTAVANLKMREE